MHRRTTPARWRVAVAVTALAAALAPAGWVAAPAVAAPGTAGTWAGLAYRAGSVCGTGASTTPLASWDLGVGTGYLTQAVTATGSVASALPPLPSVGPQSTTLLDAGSGQTIGSLDPGRIAGLAALLGRYGDSQDDTVVAALAHLVMTAVSGSAPDGCADAATESGLAAKAAALAGPYTVTLSAHAAALRPGKPDATTVTVDGASGAPVPGARVTVTADSGVLAGGATSTVVTTGTNGTARVPLTVASTATSPAAAAVALHASVSVDTALTVVTAQATPSPGDPTGQTVPAVVAASPSAATADQTLTVDTAAHPRLTVGADPQAALVGAQITPVVTVTGLEGHAAHVTATSRGPLPLTTGTLCSTRTAADFAGSATHTVTGEGDLVGDGQVRAAPWTAAGPGCYWISATVATTDSTPQADASGAIGHAVLVTDTKVTGTLGTPLVGRGGSTSVTVRARHTYGAQLSLRTVLRGPVAPGADSTGCSGVDFAGAPARRVSTAPLRPASGSSVGATVPVTTSGLGCTQVAPQLVLHAAGTDAAQDLDVDVDLGAAPAVLAIAPTVLASTTRGWGQTGSRIAVQVSTASTFRQPAHVQVRLMRVPSTDLGCRGVSFRGAAAGAAGPRVASVADYTPVTVDSTVLRTTGCYQPVAELVMDANPRITATSTPSADSLVGVGVAPPSSATADRHTGGGTPSPWLLVIALVLFAVLLVPALVYVVRVAREQTPPAGSADGVLPLFAGPRPD